MLFEFSFSCFWISLGPDTPESIYFDYTSSSTWLLFSFSFWTDSNILQFCHCSNKYCFIKLLYFLSSLSYAVPKFRDVWNRIGCFWETVSVITDHNKVSVHMNEIIYYAKAICIEPAGIKKNFLATSVILLFIVYQD